MENIKKSFAKKVSGMKSSTTGCSLYASGENEPSMMSPVTELTLNFEQSSMSTPRRRLSLSSTGTPTPHKCNSVSESLESGIEPGSPALLECPEFESPTLENIRCKSKQMAIPSKESLGLRRRIMQRYHSSPVLQRKPLQPLNMQLQNSPFHSISNEAEAFVKENHSDLSLVELDDKFPDRQDSGCPDWRIKSVKARPHSAPTLMDNMDADSGCYGCAKGDDDGFFSELLKDVGSPMAPSKCGALSSGLMGLISDPIVSLEDDKENAPPRCSSSLDDHMFVKPIGLPFRCRSTSFSVKREKPSTDCSPISRKRSRGCISQGEEAKIIEKPKPRLLLRSQSFDTHTTKSPGIDITSLLDIDDKHLIGDRSREYCLPMTESKHPDLKAISPATLAAVLDREYQDVIDKCTVIDCRFPYEYDGGHIRGAVNIFDRDDLLEQFIAKADTLSNQRHVLVFHCEFSSKRGPNLCRFLRNKDRDVHKQSYPKLHYPEMYILEGGYKEFFASHKGYCEPQGYMEMVDERHVNELKHFSKRSKSWTDSLRHTGLRY